jgi:hypothetical protein
MLHNNIIERSRERKITLLEYRFAPGNAPVSLLAP